ncbi:MAG TPA: anti-sigma factor [Bryobacteraceae bacterium]|nr:anti-sigma factor [Bryobacteraceae bacterium]
MSCEELRDSYELYALGIAEEPERVEIREHLDRNCPTCVPGVRGARALMTVIGAALPEAQPPARLRTRVLAIAGGAPARRLNWSPVWAAVAAGAVIAAVLFNNREHRAAAELAALQSQAAAQTRELARLNEAMAILNQPDAKQVVFGGAAPQPPRGRVFIDPRRGVLLLASNLPPAPEGKIYEMWVIPKAKGGKPVAAGLFQSAGDGTALHVRSGPVDLAATGIVAVTLEPAAGVDQPTTTPIIAASL